MKWQGNVTALVSLVSLMIQLQPTLLGWFYITIVYNVLCNVNAGIQEHRLFLAECSKCNINERRHNYEPELMFLFLIPAEQLQNPNKFRKPGYINSSVSFW